MTQQTYVDASFLSVYFIFVVIFFCQKSNQIVRKNHSIRSTQKRNIFSLFMVTIRYIYFDFRGIRFAIDVSSPHYTPIKSENHTLDDDVECRVAKCRMQMRQMRLANKSSSALNHEKCHPSHNNKRKKTENIYRRHNQRLVSLVITAAAALRWLFYNNESVNKLN